MKVCVVGAGIVGLCTAWALARRGLDVTIVDQGPIPNPASASFDQHRMIRPHYGGQIGYTALAMKAFDAWDLLWQDLDRSHFVATGVLAIDCGDTPWMQKTRLCLAETGLDHSFVDGADLETMAPMLTLPRESWGVLVRRAGVLLADRIVTDIAEWLKSTGARLLENDPVTAVLPERGSVVFKSGEELQFDRIIVAAGAWSASVLPKLAARTAPIRSSVAYVSVAPEVLQQWRTAPTVFLLSQPAHLYALPPVAGTELKFGGAPVLRRADPDEPYRPDERDGDATLAQFSPWLAGADRYRVSRTAGSYYSDTPDKAFIVEADERMMCIAGCGGRMFKFGALMGQLAAEWAIGETSDRDIAAWSRKTSAVLPDHRR